MSQPGHLRERSEMSTEADDFVNEDDDAGDGNVPEPVNTNVGSKETQFKGKASNPNERKSIAEDPEGKSNASGK